MDLDVFGVSVETLKKNGYKILADVGFKRQLQTYGIEDILINDPAKAKQTETTQRFRARLVTTNGEELPTKVEFSRRHKIDTAHVVKELISPDVIHPFKRLSFMCLHYTAQYAVAQKISALGGRSETQARDVFDLYIFDLGGHLRRNVVHASTTTEERLEAIVALLSLDYEAYRSQVVEYLEPSKQADLGTSEQWNQMCDILLDVLDEP
jgi:hypothetical protein